MEDKWINNFFLKKVAENNLHFLFFVIKSFQTKFNGGVLWQKFQ